MPDDDSAPSALLAHLLSQSRTFSGALAGAIANFWWAHKALAT